MTTENRTNIVFLTFDGFLKISLECAGTREHYIYQLTWKKARTSGTDYENWALKVDYIRSQFIE